MRFVSAGFTTPKPFIEVKGKTILDWTMSSVSPLLGHNPLSFAIRSEHEAEHGFKEKLRKVYGQDIKFFMADGPIRGNLYTGLEVCQNLFKDKNQPVLFLDSDNKYDIINFQNLVDGIREKDFVVLCYFNLEDRDDLKWGFCAIDPNTQKVFDIKEKEYLEYGKPMVGFFYWSSVDFFQKIAESVISKEEPAKNGEYYMTQGIKYALKNNFSVHAFESTHMDPLGTPEDVEKFEKS